MFNNYNYFQRLFNEREIDRVSIGEQIYKRIEAVEHPLVVALAKRVQIDHHSKLLNDDGHGHHRPHSGRNLHAQQSKANSLK